jgi:hypothetical protein
MFFSFQDRKEYQRLVLTYGTYLWHWDLIGFYQDGTLEPIFYTAFSEYNKWITI